MASLMALGAQAIITLIIFGFLSNTNPTALGKINLEFHKLTCNLPIYNGIFHYHSFNGTEYTETHTNVDINGNPVTSGGLFGNTTNPFAGTFFVCYDANAGISNTPSLAISTVIKEYGANCFSVIPCGMLGYVGDYLSAIVEKVQVFFTLIAFYLTPVNFEILGFTLADISPLAQIAILSLYGFDYIMIGIFIYKTLSPYTGVH